MASPPTTGPSILISGLSALGKASPSQVADWYRDTYGSDLPVTEATLRQSATRLTKQGRVHSVPDEHGVYAPGPPPEAPSPRYRTLEDYDAERAARTEPTPEAITPWLVVSRIYDERGTHVADEVKAYRQVSVPYAKTLRSDGTLVDLDTPIPA